jgi:FixJ family two-component response regulator
MDRSDGASGKRTILVLDDDSAVRDSLKFSLGIEGFEVHTYASAKDLLSDEGLFASSSCLIVDFHMPAMNGLEVVTKLRDRRNSMPAILITGHPDANIRECAAAAGVALIEKPFSGTSLIDCIHATIEAHSYPS